MVLHRRTRIIVDCGSDWRGRLWRHKPDAVVITHAHPDHAAGLDATNPAPVYATSETWRALGRGARPDHLVLPRVPFRIGTITLEAFPVDHSLRCPAVGYRIAAGDAAVFYVPDVSDIPDQSDALAGIALYIGDGATLTRPIMRRRGTVFIGHAPIRTQLGWCRRHGVRRAAFTHCGSQIVGGRARDVDAVVRDMGRARCVHARIAHDGLELLVQPPRPSRCGAMRKRSARA